MISKTARDLKVDRLPRKTFLKRSGLSSWIVDKHFDKWSDACRAAGVVHGAGVDEVPKERSYTDQECLAEMRRVAALRDTMALSTKQYNDYARISSRTISRRFGGWQKALAAAGLEHTPGAERCRRLNQEECVQELQRVARALGRSYLTADDFDTHGKVSAFRVVRVFGSWHAALQKAGLDPSPHFMSEVSLSQLADDFLRAAIDLGRIPTIIELTRRSRHVSHTFSGKHGGYRTFKLRAIDHLLSTNAHIPPAVRELFESERLNPRSDVAPPAESSQTPPHRQGRTLNFRAFTYAPTCEHDVV